MSNPIPVIDQTLNVNSSLFPAAQAINTLQGLNQARTQFLNNQALQATTPYAGQQAQANLGLTQAQTAVQNATAQFFPMTAKSGWLGSLARMTSAQAASDNSDLSRLTSPQGQALMAANSPEGQAARQQFMDIQNRKQQSAGSGLMGNVGSMLGGQNMGAGTSSQPQAPLVNTQSPIMSFLQRLTGQSQQPPAGNAGAQLMGGMQPQSAPQPMGNGAMVTPQPSMGANAFPNGANNPNLPASGQSMNLTPEQIARTQQMFGSGQAPTAGATQAQPTSADDTIKDAASNINAKNALVNPGLTQKFNYAKNMLTTLKTYGNPAVTFAKYMGPSGWAQYHMDSITNRNDPTYINYTNFRNKLAGDGALGGHQLTQFLQGSVQPQAQAAVDSITSPFSFSQGAEGSAKAWDDTINALRSEGATAASSVNSLKDFNKNFPAQTPQDTLNNMNGLHNAGKDENVYFRTLAPSLQQAVYALHKGREKNG